MTINELLQAGSQRLKEKNIENSTLDARFLLEYSLKCNRMYLIINGNEEISEEKSSKYLELITKRKENYPLQYIIGEQEFMGLCFKVNENVLIPRQDTEILVEEVIKNTSDRSEFLDMCCGSGCIGISIDILIPNSRVTCTDISKEALRVAQENNTQIGAKVKFIESDLFSKITDRYEVIVSNPPYIRTKEIEKLMPEVRCFEPTMALDGKDDGLFFYREIAMKARKHLYGKGMLFFEIGFDQADDVRKILVDAGYTDIKVVKDLASLDRVIYGRYL